MSMLHTSDLRQFRYCPRLYWLKQHQLKSSPIAFIQMIQSLGTALTQYLGVTEYFQGRRGMSADESLQVFASYEWCFGLRFEAHGLRVKIPGLHRDEKGVQIYFTTLSTNPKIEDSAYYAQLLWVLHENGIYPNQLNILYLNKDYIRSDVFSIKDCFKLSDQFLKPSGFIQGDCLKIVTRRIQDPREDILQIQTIQTLEDYPMSLEECPHKQKCEAFKICFPEVDLESFEHEHLPASVRKALKSEESDELNPLSRSDYAQMMARLNGGRFVDQNALRHWFAQFKDQIVTFVDFEWDTYGIPPFKGMRPFDVMPFQYSMHILGSEELKHQEFLGQGDCREEFIQSFLSVLPKYGPILAYNAFGAEVIRLRHLGQQFPQYAFELDEAMSRFVDLAQVFVGGVVYDQRMRGSFSLKNLIHAIDPELSYESLAISHGIQAVLHYRNLSDEEDDGITREALLSYCHMDTFAMVKVFEWLKTLV